MGETAADGPFLSFAEGGVVKVVGEGSMQGGSELVVVDVELFLGFWLLHALGHISSL